MDPNHPSDELSTELEQLRLLLEAKAFDNCLKRGLALVDRFYGSPLLHYAIAACLFETQHVTDATMHLEIAATKFSLSPTPDENELVHLTAVAGLLVRTGHFAHLIRMINNNLKLIRWPSDNVDFLNGLVNICMTAESNDTALALLDKAFDTYSDSSLFAEYLLITAMVAHASDNTDLEFESYIKALELEPGNAKIHSRISRFLGRLKRWDLASDHIKFVKKIDPSYKTGSIAQDFFNLSKSGSFEEQDKLKEKWLSGEIGSQDSRAPFAALIATDDGEFLLNEARLFAEWTTLIPNKPKRSSLYIAKPSSHDKIRVGYVSADFRNHAVSHLITDLIGQHNRNEFEIYGYSISMLDQSVYRRRIADNFDKFYSLENTATSQIIKTIDADQPHILVDLTGYTQGFNQTLFNRINGPLIVNYLGYPGTTGHPQFDYIIGDPIVIPPDYDRYYSEKVLRLDCSYQANSPSREVVEVDFNDTNLPSDAFIFCNFNTRQKLNRDTLLAWQSIVQRCPDSVLWLLDPGPNMRQEILKVLDSIKQRVFFAEETEISRHLGRVGYGNLFLDSFPYGAHTTASDAIFRGVPLLARSGESFQSRVAHSIVHFAGLPDMYAETWGDFVEKGKGFYDAYTAAKGQEIKDFLLDQKRDRHPYNIKWTTEQIENAYKAILN